MGISHLLALLNFSLNEFLICSKLALAVFFILLVLDFKFHTNKERDTFILFKERTINF